MRKMRSAIPILVGISLETMLIWCCGLQRTSSRCVPIIVCALLTATAASAQNEALSRIEGFSKLCENDISSLFIEAKFAPVRRLGEGEQPKIGTWQYIYETPSQRYPDNKYILNDDTGNKIDFISILHSPTPGTEIPPYLFHVISVPSQSQSNHTKRLTGFIARYDWLQKEKNNPWKNEEYRTLLRSRVDTEDNSILTYVRNDLPEDIASHITTIWRNTFKNAMTELVTPSHHLQDPLGYYTHTFIYQDTPETVKSINKAGDRRNSSRIVKKSGKAFGFVLDNNGECLAWTWLKLVDP